ncbi:MAG: hypothetical protein JRH11_01615 [Deltaproteobacteria bacterium]|nr:hypothetical protein [Deltaproteobacteria bacterium]
MCSHLIAAVATLAVLCVGCGGDDTNPPVDSGADTAIDGGPAQVAPPEAPVLTPCADGFREVALDELGVTVCEPWPEAGRAECPEWQVHFPGEAGCVAIGTPCPDTGRFATDLPSDATIFYVDPSATSGGDGSLAAPHDTLARAVTDAGDGQIIALARGTYDDAPRIRGGVTLWGACVADTVLAPTTTFGSVGAVSAQGAATVRNLRITGVRIAAAALDVEESLALDGVWIEGSANYAVAAANGARITVRDSHLGTPSIVPGLTSQTVVALNDSQVDLERVEIVGAVFGGVTSEGVGSIVRLDHVVIRDSVGLPGTGAAGRGVTAQAGGRVVVTDSVIEAASGVAALARDDGSSLLVDGSVVRGTRARGDGQFGRAISAQVGGVAEVRRSFVDGAVESGLLALSAEELSVENSVVRGVLPAAADGLYGIGVAATDSALSLSRVVIAETATAGINILGVSLGTLEDVRVVDVRGEEARGVFGRGLNVYFGAEVVASRVSVSQTRDVGVYVSGASLQATDLAVVDTAETRCAQSTCVERPGGIGLGVYADSTVIVERFELTASALAGIQIATGGDALVMDGVVRGNPIGANVQVADYDLGRIMSGVHYLDNGVNLDAVSLPVPEVPEAVEE